MLQNFQLSNIFEYFDDASQLDDEISSFYWGNPSNMSDLQLESPMLWVDEDILITTEADAKNVVRLQIAYYIVSHTEVGERRVKIEVYGDQAQTPLPTNQDGTQDKVFAGAKFYDQNFLIAQRVFQYFGYRLAQDYTDLAEPDLVAMVAYAGNADNDVGWRVELSFDFFVDLEPCNPYVC